MSFEFRGAPVGDGVRLLVLALGLAAVVPAGLLARRVSWATPVLAATVGVLPFLGFDPLTLDFLEQPYRGASRSLEIAVLDLVALTLHVALPAPRPPAPYRAPRYLYLVVAAFSLSYAVVPLYTAFSVVQIVRAYVLFGAVYRLAQRPKLATALGKGLAIGVLYSAVMALEQRYVQGMFQVSAGFEHPNSLGMAVNLVVPIALAVSYEGKGDKLAIVTIGAGAICIVLALSRGALLMFAFAVGIVFIGSIVRRFSRRKLYTTILLGIAATVLLGKSLDTIVERFVTAPEASVTARGRFEAAAQAMLEDHPLGIGLNNYSHVLEHGGYADDFDMPEVDRAGLAHHVYWLTAAELGYLGLLSYLWLIAAPWWTAVRGALRLKGDVRGDILLGCAAGMTAMHIHGLAEWIARQTSVMYLFWTVAGLAAAMTIPGVRDSLRYSPDHSPCSNSTTTGTARPTPRARGKR